MKKRILSLLMSTLLCCNLITPALAVDIGESGNVTAPEEIAQALTKTERERLNFNQGWKFVRRNIPAAISPDYDMDELKRWENVNLPHSIRLEPLHGSEEDATFQGECMYVKHFPLSAENAGKKLYIEFEGVMGVTDVWINGTHMHTALADHAPAISGDANTNYGGYLPFIIEISDVVKFDGTDNVITVLADNRDNGDVPPGKPQASLDFTYFGGIYRNVWLETTSPVHITDELFENIEGGGGILVEYPAVTAETATVSPKTHVRNETNAAQSVALKSELLNQDGASVGTATASQQIASHGDYTFDQEIIVSNPNLWNIDNPYLHTLVSTVTVDGVETDRVETTIGIRKITIDRDKGLIINGEVAPLMSGGNRHQDYPIIGNAAPDSLQYRDAVEFKKAGFNIVRAAHYPMSEEFVKACDELGLLLYEAAPGWQWYPGTEVFDLRVRDNIRQLIRRDRNRPCMLAYEIVLNESYSVPKGYTRESARIAKAEQPEALIATEGQLYKNEVDGRDDYADIMFGRPGDGTMEHATKALGFVREYGDSWTEDHSDFKARRTARGTREQTGAFYPGGEGRMLQQANDRLFSWNYKNETPQYTHDDSLLSQYQYRNANSAYFGGTMWTAQDNRGYGSKMSLTGIWDPYRLPKFAYYAYESQRPVATDAYLTSKGVENGPNLFIASYWGEQAPDIDVPLYGETSIGTDAAREIYVYSNAETVTLTVEKDGETLYEVENQAALTNSQYADIELLPHPPFEFKAVPYAAGSTLKAVGYDADGNKIASQSVATAGKPAGIRLAAPENGVEFTADGSDIICVYAYVVDAAGNVCPEAGNQIAFSTTDNACIVGDGIKRVGANPINAEAGIASAYVQAGSTPGTVTVTAAADGLSTGTLTLNAQTMTEPTAAYTEIPREGASMDASSMYLAEKEMSVVGGVTANTTLTMGGKTYEHCLEAAQAYAEYELNGAYKRLTTKVGVPTANGGISAIFKVYTDGVLRYASQPVSDGQVQMQEIDVDIAGAKTLRLSIESEDQRVLNGAWLSPYVYEGEYSPDNSELYETNYAGSKSVTATHGAASAALATDGSSDTSWIGDIYSTGTNQSITIDLGKVQDIRNTRIELGVDNVEYTYNVLTSRDNTNWDKKVAGTKRSGWTNAARYMDEFTASAQYVKIEFTEVSEGKPPQVREVAVYPDLGVASVTEYNLKGLSIEGKDIAFAPYQTAYEIDLEGYETDFVVRALAEDPAATMTVNGISFSNSANTVSLSGATPITVTEPDASGNIVIEVTPASGSGKKTYTVHVNGEFGLEHANRFDAGICFVPGHNGANGWTYEEYTTTSGKYTPLTDAGFQYTDGLGYWEGSNEWLRSGPVFMHPMVASDAVKTFTAPKSGEVKVRAQVSVPKSGGIKVKILQNDTQIWPDSGDGKAIQTGPEDIAVTANVEAGDKIRLFVNSNGSNSNDNTLMPASVTYVTAADKLQDLIDEMDNVYVISGNQLDALNQMLAQYDALSENDKQMVGEKRIAKLREDIALATLMKAGTAGIGVVDQGKHAYNANLSQKPNAGLKEDAEQGQVLSGYFAIDNDGARNQFNQVIGGDNSFTIEAMIRPNTVTGTYDTNVIMSKGDNTSTFRIYEASLNFFIKNSSGNWQNADVQDAFTETTAKQWHHVAAVYDGANGGSVALYLDGVMATKTENVGAVSTEDVARDLCIGMDPVKGRTTKSDFRYVRLYNGALSEEQLNADDADKLANQDVQLWYDFSESAYVGTGDATDIHLDATELVMGVGTQQPLGAKMVPYYAEDVMSYTSSAENAVHVDENGLVTAVTGGTATITVSLRNGKVAKTVEVTVSPETFLVQFDSNGGLPVDNQRVANGARVEKPVDPTKTDYTFVGWYMDAACTMAYDFSTPVTSAFMLYAKWMLNTEDDVAVTGVTLDKTSLNFYSNKGDKTVQLTVSVKPENATNKDVTWTSSKTSVATVSDTGVVTAVANGTATITATTADGGKTATCTVTVSTYTAPSSGGSSGGSSTVASKPSASVSGTGGKVSSSTDGTVTITPDTGYQIAKITVNGKDVSVPASGKLTGLKSTDKVVVTFEKVQQPTKPGAADFADMQNHWAKDAVQFVTENGIMNGTGTNTFGPDASMTRAMVWTVLARMKGVDTATGANWYEAAQKWSMENGISDGTMPEGSITREQLATLLYRYSGSPKAAGVELSAYKDSASVSAYAKDAMLWAVQQGLISGNSDGTLNPAGNAARAEVATILMRLLKK